MKVYNLQTHKKLNPALMNSLYQIRRARHFVETDYLNEKISKLNQYMQRFNLKSCVVAVSGGIDSAVTLGIVHKASQVKDSPIQKIAAVSLPIFSEAGATNQDVTLERGREIANSFGLPLTKINLTQSHKDMKQAVDKSFGVVGQGWATGQLVAYTRTPALYYITSLLAEMGLPGIVCGTTNRDEGAYLGYFGKASDGMVDIQVISDIHKSEVYKLAKILGVPKCVTNAVPTGDMYDGRIDEEVFGATYAFVELYINYLALEDKSEFDKNKAEWPILARRQFNELSKRIEKLHNYNIHKYLVGSPSVHLDIYERAVPGGWTKSHAQS